VNLVGRAGYIEGQTSPGGSSKIALYRNLRGLNKLVRTERIDSIALPKLGGGIGSMDWYETRGLIHSQLGDLLIPIYVYVGGREGQLAFEPGR
jgi:hypothetical protein